jgi:hypothetical protein
MRLVWVSFLPLRKTRTGTTADHASTRYRLLLPAHAIPGSKVTYLGAAANRRTLLERFAGAEAVVLGKFVDAPLGTLALDLAAALRKAGVRVIVDFSDDHFNDPVLGPFYRALANAADGVVAATPGLAETVKEHTPVPVTAITDPVEGKRGAARETVRRPPRLLWFGHPNNLRTLAFGMPQIERRCPDAQLTIMTAPGAEGSSPQLRIRDWSLEALFEELRECDAVIIPSDPQDPRKAVKSPNRFTESLWAGRFVLAHALPSYEPLAAYGWVGEDLGEGLAWLLDNPEAAAARVRAGQDAVAKHFSPQAIGRVWQAAIAGA